MISPTIYPSQRDRVRALLTAPYYQHDIELDRLIRRRQDARVIRAATLLRVHGFGWWLMRSIQTAEDFDDLEAWLLCRAERDGCPPSATSIERFHVDNADHLAGHAQSCVEF